MSDYPLPSHAAYIWAAGDKILLTFPGYEGTESRRFNTVVLNPTEHSTCKCCKTKVPSHILQTLFAILQSRANAKGPFERKIASPGTPTQHQWRAQVERFKRKRAAQSAEEKVQKILTKLKMTPEELLALKEIMDVKP